MKKQTLLIIITAIMAGIVGLIVHYFISEPPLLPPKTITLTTPMATQLPDLSGQQQKLAQWRGKILIVNFWATWCPSCLTEIPEFMTLQRQYADKNVQVIGIAIEDKQAVLDYTAKVKINYPILIAGDTGVEISKAWGNVINSVPFTVVIDPQGDIIYRQLGEVTRDKLLEVIQPLLKMRVVAINLKTLG